ncbi:hypothetical protein [Cellulomonas cellasea]|uniref:Uncharacterized protein n=1 Tax=Cellulomonas cellasea TaxID=43670 RepID=A0A7W4UI29_9CELL|nr:hypothetical protein [Cellulomonas cellasea]MBB2924556.1 hypothetical protein [Cellulomonas cellasea]
MPPLARRRSVALAALAAVLAGGWLAPAAAAPEGPANVLTQLRGATPEVARSSVRVVEPYVQGLTGGSQPDALTAGERGKGTDLVVRAPFGRPKLEPGHYDTVSSATQELAALTLPSLGGCSTWRGSFDVLDVEHDANGRLTRLALDYRAACRDGELVSGGSLRWNSDVPYALTQVEPPHLYSTRGGIWSRGTSTVTNAGTAPQTYGAAEWSSALGVPKMSVPVVERDHCAGRTLAPGESCTVEVAVLSDGRNDLLGVLRVPDGTPRGRTNDFVAFFPFISTRVDALVAAPRRGAIQLLYPTWDATTYDVLRSTGTGTETRVAQAVRLPWTDNDVATGAPSTYRVVPTGQDPNVAGKQVVGRPLPVPTGEEGTFTAAGPVRVVDTRLGTGVRQGPVGPGETIRFDPAAGGAIPSSGVSAVLLNVTGTAPTAPTHVRVWPSGTPLPDTSSLNLAAGQSRPNQVVVPLGADGQVALHNNAGYTHLLVDVQGYYSTADGPRGGGFHPTEPERALDTRTKGDPIGADAKVWVPVDVAGATEQVAAVDINLTVTQPTAHGHLTAWPGDAQAPGVSNANFVPGQTVANHAVVPVSAAQDGTWGFWVSNSAGRTHVIVDVLGWYGTAERDGGLRFAPSTTSRVTDTRTTGRPANGVTPLVVPGDRLPAAVAQVVNLTATQAPAAGHLVVWGGEGGAWPTTSAVNFARSEDSPNLATVETGLQGQLAVGAQSSNAHVIIDHLGFFY